MTMDRPYIEPLYLLMSFLKFYVLNVVNRLSDWTVQNNGLKSINELAPPYLHSLLGKICRVPPIDYAIC